MRGDFSRDSFKSEKQYSSVRLQQGRVLLDADWNEQADIQRHRERRALRDLIGYAGGPEGGAGFKIEVEGPFGLQAGKGRYYVDGILCENFTKVSVDTTSALYAQAGDLYLAYLDVWERQVTALEDGDLREVALGGPDTSTRSQVVNQVKLLSVDENDCSPFAVDDWAPDGVASTGALAARTVPADVQAGEDDCLLPPQTGYRGLENQLYRVEIHRRGQAGAAKFKWSRENGSVVARWLSLNNTKLTIAPAVVDDKLGFKAGDWVELTDDSRELSGRAGVMVQLLGADRGELTANVPNHVDFTQQLADGTAKVRRWEGIADTNQSEGEWLELEDGLQVTFTQDTYRAGDYWLIPARAFVDSGDGQGLGNILWPADEAGAPRSEPRHGTAHVYAPLAICRKTSRGWEVLTDCRSTFSPLTKKIPPSTEPADGGGCCVSVRPGEDIQAAIDQVIEDGGGCISLCAGLHEIEKPLQLFGARNLTISGAGEATRLWLTTDREEAGILLQDCQDVTLERMAFLGHASRGLVMADRDDQDGGVSRRLSLRHVTLVNTPVDSARNRCALHLDHIKDVAVESSRLAGPVGIMSVGSEHQHGIDRLQLRDVDIRFRTYGIQALTGRNWLVADSRILGLRKDSDKVPKVSSDDAAALAAYLNGIFDGEVALDDAIAVFAQQWHACALRECHVHTIRVGLWQESRASGNRVDGGMEVDWLQRTTWDGNRVSGDVGLTLAGGYQAQIIHNRIEGSRGIGNGYAGGNLVPMIDLTIKDNVLRIAASDRSRDADTLSPLGAIDFAGFVPLGGLRIVGNCLRSDVGRGVRLVAHPAQRTPLDGEIDVSQLLEQLAIEPDSLPTAKQIVDANRIESAGAAVWSDLQGLVVRDNTITRLAQSIMVGKRIAIAKQLEAGSAEGALGRAFRAGCASEIEAESTNLLLSDERFETEAGRQKSADTLSLLANRVTTNRSWSQRLTTLAEAVKRGDKQAIEDAKPGLTQMLTALAGDHSIALCGTGCQVIGNQAITAPDVAPEQQPRGGICISVEPTAGSSASLGETLVVDNEVAAGYGDGVALMLEPPSEPDGALMLARPSKPDGADPAIGLCVRGNQIQRMGGQGITIVGAKSGLTCTANIDGNVISDCRAVRDGGVTGSAGGLRVEQVTRVSVRGNRIERCGASVDLDAPTEASADLDALTEATAVLLRSIDHIALADNDLLENRSIPTSQEDIDPDEYDANTIPNVRQEYVGIIDLGDVESAMIHDNKLIQNRGIGLLWADVPADPSSTDRNGNEREQLPEERTKTASIQDNQFVDSASGEKEDPIDLALVVADVYQLNLSGNVLSKREAGHIGIVVANEGVVLGNVGIKFHGSLTNLAVAYNVS